MSVPLLILAEAITAQGVAGGLRITLPWDWDTTPPCLSLADLDTRTVTDQFVGLTLSTTVQLDVWGTDPMDALSDAQNVFYGMRDLGAFTGADGLLVHAVLIRPPVSLPPSPPGDGPSDTSIVRLSQVWEVVTYEP